MRGITNNNGQETDQDWLIWRTPVHVIGLLLLSSIVLFFDSYSAIVEIWARSETFNHGFIIFPISAYLIWKNKHKLAGIKPSPDLWVISLLIGNLMVWLVANAAYIAVLEQLAVVVLIPIIIWIVVGAKAVSVMVFPLAYLFFAVPMGEFLISPLQDLTAIMSVKLLQFIGMPVLLEGRFIYIPSGNFEVAKACSGIRYLIASTALGSLYAYLIYTSNLRRLVFIGFSIAVPIIANGLRAFGIIILAHYSEYTLAVGVDHLIYGWLFFGIVMFLLFWVGRFFAEDQVEKESEIGLKIQESTVPEAEKSKFIFTSIMVVVVLSLSIILSNYVTKPLEIEIADTKFPTLNNVWEGPIESESKLAPVFAGADVEQQLAYKKDSATVNIHAAYYYSQAQGKELINSENKYFDDDKWRRIEESFDKLQLNDKQEIVVRSIIVASSEGRRIVWQWFQVGEKVTVSEIQTKINEILARLTGNHVPSLSVLLSTEITGEQGEARELLKDFVLSLYSSTVYGRPN